MTSKDNCNNPSNYLPTSIRERHPCRTENETTVYCVAEGMKVIWLTFDQCGRVPSPKFPRQKVLCIPGVQGGP